MGDFETKIEASTVDLSHRMDGKKKRKKRFSKKNLEIVKKSFENRGMVFLA